MGVVPIQRHYNVGFIEDLDVMIPPVVSPVYYFPVVYICNNALCDTIYFTEFGEEEATK